MEAYKYNPDTWDGRVMYSLSKTLDFSLKTPWEKLPEKVRNAILNGVEKKLTLRVPPDAKVKREEYRIQGGRVRRHCPQN